MEGITLFSGLWFVLVAVLIAGYFILDGFDLGAGVLYPFIAKTKTEKAIVRRSIGPVWDGNEVWLITAGGALFAAFPPAYATTFSGFYLAVMLVLFGLIVRAVSLEYRVHDDKWGGAWNACFFIGSLLPALLFGVAIGNVFAGIPMNSNGDYTGIPLLGLVTPFTLATGVLGLLMFMSAGATWIAQKAPKPSDIQARAAKLRIPLQIITLVVFL
ncbi:MAG: cytochrome d ubiquinol oxidase subunit II, partial [Coriobacteriaceae bacterium]|nr:cytochrome d ubiquinol oxidase subunit II [Coriobacteriaceae bacterium]